MGNKLALCLPFLMEFGLFYNLSSSLLMLDLAFELRPTVYVLKHQYHQLCRRFVTNIFQHLCVAQTAVFGSR